MGRHFGGHAHSRQLPTVTDSEKTWCKMWCFLPANWAPPRVPRFAPGFSLSVTVGNCRECACPPKWRPIRLIETHQVVGRKGCWTQCNVSPETDFQQIDHSSDIPIPCQAPLMTPCRAPLIKAFWLSGGFQVLSLIRA